MTSTTAMHAFPDAGRSRFATDVIRWVGTLPAKNGWWPLLVRGFLPALALTVLGAVFTALGPAPVRPGPGGVPPASDMTFIMIGFLVFGQVVTIVANAWTHSRDVSSRELGMTYVAMPDRAAVVAGTALFGALFAAVSGFVSTVAGVVAFCAASGADIGATAMQPQVIQMVLGLTAATGFLSAMAVALAVVVRQPIATVVFLVLWATFGEDTLSQFPGLGDIVNRCAPMANAHAMAGVVGDSGVASSALACGAWLAVLTVAAVGVAAAFENRRRGWVL